MTNAEYRNPVNWLNAEDTMKKFGVSNTTLNEWVKADPRILKYIPGRIQRVDKLGRTTRRCPMYNAALILDSIYVEINQY